MVWEGEFISVIEETRKLLKDHTEWRERYAEYADKISENTSFIKQVRGSFHEWSPLNVYLNISSAKNAEESIGFELRYLGQTVATLTGNNNTGLKLSTGRYGTTNERDFGCSICLSAVAWDGKDAREFRSFFKARKGTHEPDAKSNEEHRLQSMLLTEFSRRQDKVIRHIRPVMLSGVRFPMPTPLSASNHENSKYSREKGGGIDILTRIGTGGKATRLCIMELKDENRKSEPPKDAVKQALAYATFVRELLRSDAGLAWWKIFGFGGKVMEPLELYATCVMPSDSNNNDYSFGDMELNIEKDAVRLHYLYFKEDNQRIRIKPGDTSLPVIE